MGASIVVLRHMRSAMYGIVGVVASGVVEPAVTLNVNALLSALEKTNALKELPLQQDNGVVLHAFTKSGSPPVRECVCASGPVPPAPAAARGLFDPKSEPCREAEGRMRRPANDASTSTNVGGHPVDVVVVVEGASKKSMAPTGTLAKSVWPGGGPDVPVLHASTVDMGSARGAPVKETDAGMDVGDEGTVKTS